MHSAYGEWCSMMLAWWSISEKTQCEICTRWRWPWSLHFFFSCLVKEWTTKRPIYHKVYCLIWKKNHLRFIGQAYQNSNFLILFFGEKNGRQRTELYSLIFYGIIFFFRAEPRMFLVESGLIVWNDGKWKAKFYFGASS